MARKPILSFGYLIVSILIVNNCQDLSSSLSDLVSGLVSGLSSSLSGLLSDLSSIFNSPPTCIDDIKVQYPFIIKKDRSCLPKSSPPKPLEFYINKTEQIVTHYLPQFPSVGAGGRNTIYTAYITGGLLDGVSYLYSIVVRWNVTYTSNYTVGGITNPYGEVATFFLNENFNLFQPYNCNNSVALIFYIAIGKGANDTSLDNFLKNIKTARDYGTTYDTYTKIVDYFEFAGKTIFKKEYYLYKNVDFGYACSTVIVFPENILISQSQFDENFGTSNEPSNNIYTPQTNDTKTVYSVTGGIKMNITS